jgi:Fe-S-cluster containining protein
MFRVVSLDEGEERPLRASGAPVSLTPEGKLEQPCGALRADNCCAVYADRPRICRAFRCLALAGLEAGRMTPAESQELIDDVLERRRALADALGLADVRAAVAEARRDEPANSPEVAERLGRLRRGLLILQLSPNDPILAKR